MLIIEETRERQINPDVKFALFFLSPKCIFTFSRSTFELVQLQPSDPIWEQVPYLGARNVYKFGDIITVVQNDNCNSHLHLFFIYVLVCCLYHSCYFLCVILLIEMLITLRNKLNFHILISIFARLILTANGEEAQIYWINISDYVQ